MIVSVIAAACAFATPRVSTHPVLQYRGRYVEGCSCSNACPAELTGVDPKCNAVGGFVVSAGTFDHRDISGVRFAYANAPGWVTCYIQAPTEAKFKAASDLCKAAFGSWGKMPPPKKARVDVFQNAGTWRLTIDGGKVMDLVVRPVVGSDKKTAVSFSNLQSPLHPKAILGTTVRGTYKDGEHEFQLKDSSGLFQPKIDVKTKL